MNKWELDEMMSKMIGEGFEKGGDSSRRMYIRSTSDILPKWKGIRNSYILLN